MGSYGLQVLSIEQINNLPRWNMIHPVMHILYLCFLGDGNLNKAFRENSNWAMRYEIRNIADVKKYQCKGRFFLEGEMAWGKVNDHAIREFLETYKVR